MDHPLIREENSDLRRRMVQLLRAGYSIRRDGSIVFVCGGNKSTDMRIRFREFCKVKHPELEIFHPEYAMKDYFSNGHADQFDIADFEELVADLSHAIVLFPEAAGSYAELGYFSLVQSLASKTILAMDLAYQGDDSFISMGPAKKIDRQSVFNPIMQITYINPAFEDIVKRIKRIEIQKKRKNLSAEKFKNLSNYERFCLIYQCFELMRIATIDDVIYILRALFKAHLSELIVKQLASILVGAGYLRPVGEFGHYHVAGNGKDLTQVSSGYIRKERELQLEIAEVFSGESEDFLLIVEEASLAG